VQQGSLFKQECISFREELLETTASEQLQLQPAYSSTEQSENSTINTKMGINEHINDKDHRDDKENTND
jgi:hypothetical protein